jgi:hypothetical protein
MPTRKEFLKEARNRANRILKVAYSLPPDTSKVNFLTEDSIYFNHFQSIDEFFEIFDKYTTWNPVKSMHFINGLGKLIICYTTDKKIDLIFTFVNSNLAIKILLEDSCEVVEKTITELSIQCKV